MLEISPDQFAAFEGDQERVFQRQLFDFLIAEYPDLTQDREGVAALVEVAIVDAREAGFFTSQGIALYVVAAFMLGLEVKQDANFLREVRHSGVGEEGKIAWLSAWLEAIAEEVAA